MVKEYLLAEWKFLSPLVLPSISRNDPNYHQLEVMRDGILEITGDY
jgi:DNA-directed RNA polymerase subunit H (RpoH/RPB5)